MASKLGLLVLGLIVSGTASAFELTIGGVPVEALAQAPFADAMTSKHGRSTELEFKADGTTYRITRGHELVLRRLKERQAFLLADPKLASQAAENAKAIALIESAMAKASFGSMSTMDCSASVDWVPYFRIWYNGTVSSTVQWQAWTGPPAPWQIQLSARVEAHWAADGQWYYIGDGPNYTTVYTTTIGQSAQASTITWGWSWQSMNLYAYGAVVSTDPTRGCEPLYFYASRNW